MRTPTHARHATRGVRTIAAVLLCALLAGCGTSRSGTSASRPRAAAQAPQLTRQRALAFARAVNLTPGDVPGFAQRSDHERESSQDKRLEDQLRRCAGAVRPAAELAQVPSPSYQLRRDLLDLGVSSEVGVAPTAVGATQELAALRSARVRRCFSRYLDSVLGARRHQGTTLQPVSIAAGTPPAPGASGSFGWRVKATFTVRRLPLSLYVDILGFVVGPARVTLVSFGALRPFPAQVQQRLFDLLLSRATARAL